LGWLLSLAAEIDDPEQVVALAFALPEQTTVLREPAAELTQRLAAYFLGKAGQSDDPIAYIEAAVWLNNLANRLSDLGRREEALAAAEEAVRLNQALAEARPDAFIPDLALSLNNLANRLSDLGRREEALTAAEEAVRLYRALAEARPDAFIPDLGLSLTNLAIRLSDLGRREEALAAAEEAVRLRRALAEVRPDSFIPKLAVSLWVVGDLYGETGNPGLAVATLAEGIRLLTPTFLKIPAAVVGIMTGILQSYLTQCTAVGREPDIELLGPVRAVFEILTSKEEKG
jgi:tetratricopeptide (TPR) repeat protein